MNIFNIFFNKMNFSNLSLKNINERIDKEICYKTIEKLNDYNLIDI